MILEDFKDSEGEWVKYTVVKRVVSYTRSGQMWYNMLARCKIGGKLQMRQPSYIGCACSFPNYQDFTVWATQQVGYYEGYHLDKDLLVKGNKVYSKDTCVFLPEQVNKFLNSRKKDRGNCPLGTCWEPRRGVYVAQCGFNGIYHYLGGYESKEDAFAAYKVFKECKAKELAEKWKSSIDPRAYKALTNYSVDIDD